MWAELACPFDRGALQGTRDWLSCRECGRGYPIVDGLPVFLAADDEPADAGQSPLPSSRDDCRRRAERLAFALRRCGPFDRRSRLLQIGPGETAELQFLRRGQRFALDISAGDMASRGLASRDGLRWVCGRGEKLPFASGAFDAVVLADVFERVASPGQMLAEACRVLREDGLLWLSSRVASSRSGFGRDAEPTFSRESLLRFCRNAGLVPHWAQRDEQPTGPRWLLSMALHERFEGLFRPESLHAAACLALPRLAA